eukprot:5359524-Alexandrium_andersonii.AAC.1
MQPARPPAWAAKGVTAKASERRPAELGVCGLATAACVEGHQMRSRWPSSLRSHRQGRQTATRLSLIHISEPTRLALI